MSYDDWPDRSTRETRTEFIARIRPYFPNGGDSFDATKEQRTKAALTSANEYHASRDPRTVAQRFGYAHWTVGDDGAVE